jgi:NADPH:quinone reductase-like Zn-dependent oxidoreductase
LPNSTVFINGGSGGVGLFAIQLARHLVGEQGNVITTCSLKNTSLVKQHGASEAIDYTSIKNLPEYLSEKYSSEKFDVVLDCIGDFEMYNASPAFLQPKGDYVVIGAPIPKGAGNFIKMVGRIGAALLWPRVLGGTPRRLKISVMQATGEKMQRVGELVKGGKVKPVVDSVWEFDEEGVKGAYRTIMSGHARGKVVIKVLN